MANETKKDTKKQREEYYNQMIEQAFAGDESLIDQQRQEVAERLGINPEDVRLKRDLLATKLAREGVIIDLHIGRERFERSLSAEDLGIKADDEEFKEFLKNYVLMGRKRLIPNGYVKKLNSLDSKARSFLENNSFETRFGCFVPYSAYQEVKEHLEAIKAEYFAVQQEILDRYDQIKFSTEMDYRNASREVYRILTKDKYAEPDEEFKQEFVRKIMQFFPSKERIANSFYFEIVPSFVPITSTLIEDEARQKQLQLEKLKLTEEIRLQQEREEAQLQIIEAEKRTRLMEEEYKREQIRKINKEVLESHRREMEGFFDNLAGQLYSMVYEAVSAAKESYEKNGRLYGPSITRLQNLIKKVRMLNFINDQCVDEQIRELERIVETDPGYRDPKQVFDILNQITRENREILTMLGRKPRAVRGKVSAPDAEVDFSSIAKRQVRTNVSQLDFSEVFDSVKTPQRKRRQVLDEKDERCSL